MALLEKGYNHLDITCHSALYPPANMHDEPATGASVFEAELLLNGIVTQKLEYERFVAMEP